MATQSLSDPAPDEQPHIETPLIDIPGMKLEPTMDGIGEHAFARDDEAVLAALEELEKSLRGQLPG